MKHALVGKSTPEQIAIAKEAADWLLDAVATSTQDRSLLRGEPEYDELMGEAIVLCGQIACLRALHKKEGTFDG